MTQAATTSPFSFSQEPWTIWKQEEPVTLLQAPDEALRSSMPAIPADMTEEATPVPHIAIQRKQYHSVLNRINQARNKTGHFSDWQN